MKHWCVCVCVDSRPHLAGFPEDIDITRCSSTKAHAMRSPCNMADVAPGMLQPAGWGGWTHTQERCSADVVCGCVNSVSTSAASHMCCAQTLKFRCIFQTCLQSFLQLTHAWAWACRSLLSAHTWCHANGTNVKLVLLRHVRRSGLRWVSGVSTEKQLS